jgi:hypothetical protein
MEEGKMNVKELIEKYKSYEGKWNAKRAELARQIFLEDLKQLDEPRKVKVKQFVADWYEENKDDFEGNLYRCTHNIPSTFDGAELNEFERWFLNASTKPFQTLVNMHQFGYEVDEEKRYLVKIKASNQYIMSNPDENAIFFYSCRAYSKLTRKELEEAGFGWVFDCEGIEIEEVDLCH